MSPKLHVGIIFGGVSPEHEVSIASAKNIDRAIPRDAYDVSLIYVTREGVWQLVTWSQTGDIVLLQDNLSLLPNGHQQLHLKHTQGFLSCDVIFPIIHGAFGEDGCLQGLCEFMRVPYVGAGVLASAVAMDKDLCRRVVAKAGIKSLPYIAADRTALDNSVAFQKQCEASFDYPWFVKPANTGSSVGITKVKTPAAFSEALRLAFEYDDKIVVERGLSELHEVEIAALGSSHDLMLSPCVEIISHREFYDYEAKYGDKATMVLPADLSPQYVQKIREDAAVVFKEIDCYGMARIDFLIDKATKTVYFSEINTLPGFTAISQYPCLCEAAGYSQTELMCRLLVLATQRFQFYNQSDDEKAKHAKQYA
jgi:D-alanine-D-alanine ligase